MSAGYTYMELFEVRVYHHFFLNRGNIHFEGMSHEERERVIARYNINQFFNIIPTDKTMSLLRGHQLIFKPTSMGFLVLARLDSNNVAMAMSDLRSATKLTFYIRNRNPYLLNFSALTLKSEKNSVYYFSNRDKQAFLFPALSNVAPVFDNAAAAVAASDGDPTTFAYYPSDILTKSAVAPTIVFEATRSTNNNTSNATDWRRDTPAQVYDNGAAYNRGDVVSFTVAGAQGLYQALNDTTGNSPSDAANWERIRNLPLHYITSSDLIDTFPRLYNYTLSAAGITALFEIIDESGNKLISEEFTSSQNQLTHQVDMRQLPEGEYSISVTDTAGPSIIFQHSFYLSETRGIVTDTFGIIDIWLGHSHGQYSVVDASNVITTRVFELRIKSRSTVWRYLSRNNEVIVESDFNPLTKNGFLTVVHNGQELPNPDVQMIMPEPSQYYSDIFLNTST